LIEVIFLLRVVSGRTRKDKESKEKYPERRRFGRIRFGDSLTRWRDTDILLWAVH